MTHLRSLLLAVPLTFFIVTSCSSDDDSGLTDLTAGNGGSGGTTGGAKASGGANSGGSKASGGSNNAGGEPATGGGDGLGGGDGVGGDGAGGGGDMGGATSAGGASSGGAPSEGGAGGAPDTCPLDPPDDNTACTVPRAFCQWGQTRCVCQNNEQWNCETTDCPEMRPEPSTSCQGIDTRACRYGRAICVCNEIDEWACRNCPIQQPEQSANCPMVDVSCDYVDAVCTCTLDGWDCN